MSWVLKRVPPDFSYPLGAVWIGYLNPHYRACSQCPECGGTGLSEPASRFADQWYGYAPFDPRSTGSQDFSASNPVVQARARQIVGRHASRALVDLEAQRLAEYYNDQWCHHLSQEDVEALVAARRLPEFTHRPLNEEQAAAMAPGSYWTKEPNGYHPSAEEVNKWSIGSVGHDAINRSVCIEARCEREGVAYCCAECNGSGDQWESEEDRLAAEAWEREEPPTGEGYQVWETVSDGSPVSPVFGEPEALAAWLAEHKKEVANYEQWLGFIRGPGWAPTAVGNFAGIKSGVAAIQPTTKGPSR
jgi:hypothetical protein